MQVKLKDIIISQDLMASRIVYDLSILKENIKKNGVVNALVVVKNKDGQLELLDGVKRWICCYQLGIEEVPLVIYEGMTEEQIRAYHKINSHKQFPINDPEYKRSLIYLMDRYDLTLKEWATKLDKSVLWVLRVLSAD